MAGLAKILTSPLTPPLTPPLTFPGVSVADHHLIFAVILPGNSGRFGKFARVPDDFPGAKKSGGNRRLGVEGGLGLCGGDGDVGLLRQLAIDGLLEGLESGYAHGGGSGGQRDAWGTLP